jgi:hypothetical protein
MIKKTIKIPIYNDVVNVLIGNVVKTAKELDDMYNGSDISSMIDGSVLAFSTQLKKLKDNVFHNFLLIDSNAVDVIIYHESLHIAYWILGDSHVKISVENHESLAYLQGYIAEEIIKLLNKINNDDKKKTKKN